MILETVRSRDAFLTHPSKRSDNPSLETIIEWPHIGQKYWDQLPKQSASSVFDQLIQNLNSLQWVPYFDHSDGHSPHARRIVENPLIFQNIWPGGI